MSALCTNQAGPRASHAGTMSGLRLFPLVALVFGFGGEATAHGVIVSTQVVPGMAVQAVYDSGEPMAGAQVSVFAPDDPASPLLTGLADADGVFRFVPDPARTGTWAVQLRQAGHGGMVYFETGDSGVSGPEESGLRSTAGSTASGQGFLQRLIVVGAVIWGFVGTALYFRSRQTKRAPS